MSTVTPAGEETLLIVISEDTTGFGLNVIHSEVGGKDACKDASFSFYHNFLLDLENALN